VSSPPTGRRDAGAADPATRGMSIYEAIAGRRAGPTTPQTGALLVLFFGVVFPLAMLAYLAGPYALTDGFCPSTTFLSQPMGPAGPFVGGLMLGMLSFTFLALYLIVALAGTASPGDAPEPPEFARLRATRGFHLSARLPHSAACASAEYFG
jgi:hypothetical protein